MSTLSVQTITDIRSIDFANTQFAGAYNASNAAYDAANVAVVTANVAINTANAALPNVSNAVFAGNLRVTGNLQIGTNTVTIRDNHIISAEYYRMNTANHMVAIPDGNRVNTIFSLVNVSFDTANASYNSANNVGPQLAPAFNTANAAYGVANTALQNTSGTLIGNLTITGNTTSFGRSLSSSIAFNTNTSLPTSDAAIYRPADGTLAFVSNAVERMRFDSSGRPTIPYIPAFFAQGSGTQSWSGAQVETKLNFSTGNQYVTANKSAGWSSVNSRFTAPVAGTYEFVLTFVTSSGPSTGPAAILYKNGSYFIEVCIGYFSTTYCQCTGNVFLDLNVNDYVEFYISNYNATSFTLDRGRCHFSGRLIG